MVLVIVMAPFAAGVPKLISYSISVPSSNHLASEAESAVSTQFRNYSHSNVTYYVVLEGTNVLSPQFYENYQSFNATVYHSLGPSGLKSVSSVYQSELQLLNSTLARLAKSINETRSYIVQTDRNLHTEYGFIENVSTQIYNVSKLIPELYNETHTFSALVYNLSDEEYYLEANLSELSSTLAQVRSGAVQGVVAVDSLVHQEESVSQQVYTLLSQVNQTLFLVYGVPSGFLNIWAHEYEADQTLTPTELNQLSYQQYLGQTNDFGGNTESQIYFEDIFYPVWQTTVAKLSSANIYDDMFTLGTDSVEASVPKLESALNLNSTQSAFVTQVADSFNLNDFSSSQLQQQFTLEYSTEGASSTQAQFIQEVFSLGPSPSATQLTNLAFQVIDTQDPASASFIEQAYQGVSTVGLRNFTVNYVERIIQQDSPAVLSQATSHFNISVNQLLTEVYGLGVSPTPAALYNLTFSLMARGFPQNESRQLASRFDLTPLVLLRQVKTLGRPLSSQVVEQYTVDIFLRALPRNLSTVLASDYGDLLYTAYSYRQNPYNLTSTQLAVGFLSLATNTTESHSLATAFNVSPDFFYTQVAEMGPHPTSEKVLNLTLYLASRSISVTHPEVYSEIQHRLNTSVSEFLLRSYLLGEPVSSQHLLNLTIGLVENATLNALSSQPLVKVNQQALVSAMYSEYASNTSLGLAQSLMDHMELTALPLHPAEGIIHELVDPSANTTLVTLSFRNPLNQSQVQVFESAVIHSNTTDFRTYYTASPILNSDLQGIVVESEKYAIPFGVVAAAVVAGAFFLSPVAALIPTLMFGLSLLVGFGFTDIIMGRIEHQTLSFISPIVIALLALGLATDYAVLILNRFRQESQKGSWDPTAVSVKWAGEAVFTSGLTVVLSYVVLSAAHVPLFSDVGTANVIVVSAVLAGSLVFVPSVTSVLGDRVYWPGRRRSSRPVLASLTKRAVARPRVIVGAFILFTVVATVIAVTLPVNVNFLGLTPNTPAKQGLDQITRSFGGSTLIPTYVVVDLPSPISTGHNTYNETELSEVWSLTKSVLSRGGIEDVYGPVTPFNSTVPYTTLNSLPSAERASYSNSMLEYVSVNNATIYLKVVFRGDPYSNKVLHEAYSLQSSLSTIAPRGYEVLVGGGSVDSYDIIQYVYSVLPRIIEVLVAAIFVVLLVQIRSVFTPARLIATILSNVTWTLFLVWVIYTRGAGGSIFVFAPLFLVTTMLGVGMDYDIFLIVRVREEVSKGADDVSALITTAETTGGVVAALGLILSGVFLALALTRIELLQQIGVTLALGVLMDTFLVWLLYVPSLMTLARRLNWWPSDPRKP